MFPRTSRIRLTRDYERIFHYGRSCYNKYLTLKTVQNQHDLNRFGIVVSNKISKSAVARNRIKRQVRAVTRSFEPTLKKQGFDCLFLAKKEIVGISTLVLKAQVEKLLKEAKLL